MAFIGGREGQKVTYKGKPVRVQAMCVDGTRTGFWICITHQEQFHLPGTAMLHMGEGKDHLMVWYCTHHGVEVP